MCVVVVVDDLCVVLVLPNMHRQSRWTVISFGPRQVRMRENNEVRAVRRDLSAPRRERAASISHDLSLCVDRRWSNPDCLRFRTSWAHDVRVGM